jgi:LPS-assembly lipoprotein
MIARLAPLLLLAGCGLQPLYSGGSDGAVAQALAGALRDRIAAVPDASPRYRLTVELDDKIEGFGIRRDDAITRERRTLRARYQLRDAGSGAVLVDATAGSDAGIDVVRSEYATIAAENTALERLAQEVADQIVARVALYAKRQP